MAANLTPEQLDLFQEENPDFFCSITLQLMLDPVVAMDGHTYDRPYIEKWLVTNNTSPKTNAPLSSKLLVPNHALKSAIEKSLENFRKRLDSEANVKGQDTTPNPSEAVALTPIVSESSNEAASVMPSDTHSPSSSSSSIASPSPDSASSSSRSMAAPMVPLPSYSSPPSSSSMAPPPMMTSYSASFSSSSMAPSYSASSSSRSVAAPSPDSSSSPIFKTREEKRVTQEYTRHLGIIQIVETSNLVDRKLREKIRQECNSNIEKIEAEFPEIRALVSPQEIEAARLDFLRKIGAIPKSILSLYNRVREEYFGLTDKMRHSRLTPAAEARLYDLRIFQKQLEEDWPEIRCRLLLDQAKGLPLQSFVDAVSINAVPRRRVIPVPYLVNGKTNSPSSSSSPEKSLSIRDSLRSVTTSFKSRFFSEAAPLERVSSSNDKYDYLFKILVVGDSGAGKSCLILRYADDTYTANPMSTIGVDFKVRTIALNESTVRLQIWDTAERKRRLLQANPFIGAHAIIVAFDVTNRASFDNVHQHLKEIDRFADVGIIVTLVATKCDAPKAAWKVSEEEIQLLAESTRKDVFFTSAKVEENGFVDPLFEGVAKSILADKIEAAPSGPSSLSRK